jgi:hypothetical protein
MEAPQLIADDDLPKPLAGLACTVMLPTLKLGLNALSFATIRFVAVIRQTVKAPLLLRCPRFYLHKCQLAKVNLAEPHVLSAMKEPIRWGPELARAVQSGARSRQGVCKMLSRS